MYLLALCTCLSKSCTFLIFPIVSGPPSPSRQDDSALAKPTEPAAEESPNSDDENILEFSESDGESLHEAHDYVPVGPSDDSIIDARDSAPVKAHHNAHVSSIQDLLDLTSDPVCDLPLSDLRFVGTCRPSGDFLFWRLADFFGGDGCSVLS